MVKILLLDTETTGLEDPRLVQVAYQYNTAPEKYDSVNEIFKPAKAIDYGAMATHHITNAMVLTLAPFEGSATKEHIQKLIADGYVFVAHNAPFDIGVLKAEGVAEPRFYVDTKRCAMHLTQSDYHNLQYLRYSLDLKITSDAPDQIVRAHDAAGDVVVLKALYDHLMRCATDRYVKEAPNATEEEKERYALTMLINLSRTPVVLKTAKFGKHRGMAWSEIAAKHMDYIKWLYEQKKDEKPEDPDYDMDLMHTILYYLNN